MDPALFFIPVDREIFLQAFPEVLAVLGRQFFRPVALGAELAHEEAQHGRFLHEFQAADQVAVVVEPFHAVRHVFDLGQREDAAREGQAEQFHIRQNVVAVFVTDAGERAAFHPAHAGGDEEGRRQGPGRIVLLRNMGQEAPGVNMGAQAARGGHAGNAHVHHLADEVFNEGGALGNHGQVRGFIQAHGHGFNFTHGDAAVGQEAFKQGNQVLHFLGDGMVVRADAAAAGGGNLAGGEVYQVCQAAHGFQDVSTGGVLELVFTHLDEVGVFPDQGGVQHQHDAEFVANAADFTHVGNGERLAAD